MKRISMVMAVLALLGVGHVSGEEYKRRDACESIPQSALERADKSLRMTYSIWGVVPVIGDNGEWRCKINGMHVRRYDRTLLDERQEADIPLYVEKDGNIFVCDNGGCFSLDRWK